MTLVAESVDHGRALGRALSQWIARGARWAVIPQRLLDCAALAALDGDAWSELAELMPTRCREHELAGSEHVVLWHLCLLERGHDGDCGFVVPGVDVAAQAAVWAVQMDPVLRVARRAAYAAGMKVGAIACVEVHA